jgi:lysophospholipase L1-like esterase
MENWLRPMKDGYPVMLQELLSRGKASGEAPIVLNAGVGSMTSNLVASLVVNRIVHFHPKVVVIKAGYNDV